GRRHPAVVLLTPVTVAALVNPLFALSYLQPLATYTLGATVTVPLGGRLVEPRPGQTCRLHGPAVAVTAAVGDLLPAGAQRPLRCRGRAPDGCHDGLLAVRPLRGRHQLPGVDLPLRRQRGVEPKPQAGSELLERVAVGASREAGRTPSAGR